MTKALPEITSTQAKPRADEKLNNLGLIFRDLLGSPMHSAGQLALRPPDITAASAPPPPVLAADKKQGWGAFFAGALGGSDEQALRKQLKEYEQRLVEMRELASRQAHDISSLRTVAERTLHDKVATAGVSKERDEEQWRLLLQEVNHSLPTH